MSDFTYPCQCECGCEQGYDHGNTTICAECQNGDKHDEHPYCEMCETNIPLDSPKWDSRFEEPICVECGENIPDEYGTEN